MEKSINGTRSSQATKFQAKKMDFNINNQPAHVIDV